MTTTEMDSRRYSWCEACRGTGIAPTRPGWWRWPCPVCGGSGIRCDGEGVQEAGGAENAPAGFLERMEGHKMEQQDHKDEEGANLSRTIGRLTLFRE